MALSTAGAVLAVAAYRIMSGQSPPARAFDIALVAVVVAIAARIRLYVRIGQTRFNQSLADIAIMLGLLTLPWSWLALVVAAGGLVGRALIPLNPLRLLYLVAKDVTGLAVAAYVGYRAGVGEPFVATGGHLPGLLLAAGTMIATRELLMTLARAFATDRRIRTVFLSGWHVRLASAVLRMLIAIGAGCLLHFDQRFAVATPLVIVGLNLWWANHAQQRADRLAWRRLATLADTLSVLDGEEIGRAAVAGAVELFSCEEAELEVGDHTASGWLLRGGTAGIAYAGPPAGAPASRGMVVGAALAAREPAEAGRDAGPAAELARVTNGELRLRFDPPVVFAERDHYMLRALATAVGTAIRKSHAVRQAIRLATDRVTAAVHDEHSGLASRTYLLEMGAAAIRREPLALVVLRLDRLPQINDALGQPAGDRILAITAERLTGALAAIPGAGVAARLAGPEVALLLPAVSTGGEALTRTRELLAVIGAPIDVDGVRLEIGACAGVAVGGGDGFGIEELLRRAEVAMYQARDDGQGISLYVRNRDTANTERLALSGDLARGVAERQFVVAFQPIVDLGSGVVIGAEALARWDHPERGQLAPYQFVEPIERSGHLNAFTSHVLDLALTGAAQWRAAGFDFPVSVNVSPRSLLDPSFPATIPAALAAHRLPPEALTIELTETITLSHTEIVDEALAALREMGVSLALDDFGTRFSSLAMVARVPVQELKIDKAFISRLDSAAETAIVRSTIELARGLDLLVVAEGIEHTHERERLWELGCGAGQGHLFARPINARVLVARLRAGYGGVPGRLVAPLHASGGVIRMPSSRRTPSKAPPRQAPRRTARDEPSTTTPHTPPDTGGSRTAWPE